MFTLQKLAASIKALLSSLRVTPFLPPLCGLSDSEDDLEQRTSRDSGSIPAEGAMEMKFPGDRIIDVVDEDGEGLAEDSEIPSIDAAVQVSANELIAEAASGDQANADEMAKVIEAVQDDAEEATNVVDHASVLDSSADAEVDVFESSSVPSVPGLADEDASFASSLADSPPPLTPALPASLLFDQCDYFPLWFDIVPDFEERRESITACPSVLFASAGHNDFYSACLFENPVPALETAWLHQPIALMDIFEEDISQDLDDETSLRVPDSPTLSPYRVRGRSSPIMVEWDSTASTLEELHMPGSFVDDANDDYALGRSDEDSGIKGIAITWLSSVHAYVSHARREETLARWPDLERGV